MKYELYRLDETTRYEYTKKEVQNAYLQLLDIYVPNWLLDRAEYILKKAKINVNFVSLSYVIYLLLKYKYGIPYRIFKAMLEEKRVKYKKILVKTKRRLFTTIGTEQQEEDIEVEILSPPKST